MHFETDFLALSSIAVQHVKHSVCNQPPLVEQLFALAVEGFSAALQQPQRLQHVPLAYCVTQAEFRQCDRHADKTHQCARGDLALEVVVFLEEVPAADLLLVDHLPHVSRDGGLHLLCLADLLSDEVLVFDVFFGVCLILVHVGDESGHFFVLFRVMFVDEDKYQIETGDQCCWEVDIFEEREFLVLPALQGICGC